MRRLTRCCCCRLIDLRAVIFVFRREIHTSMLHLVVVDVDIDLYLVLLLMLSPSFLWVNLVAVLCLFIPPEKALILTRYPLLSFLSVL